MRKIINGLILVVLINCFFSSYVLGKQNQINNRILFVSERDGNKEIYIMNSDGTNQKRLTNNNLPDYSPKWSSDGKKIVYISGTTGDSHIYIMDINGKNNVKILTTSDRIFMPKWSLDGKNISYIKINSLGLKEIWMANIDHPINNLKIAEGKILAWSPNESNIALPTKEGKGIKFINLKGNILKTLDLDIVISSPLSWSPDGKKIAFDTWGEDISKGYSIPKGFSILDIESNQLTKIGKSYININKIIWSKDSEKIMITSGQGTDPDCYSLTIIDLTKNKEILSMRRSISPIFSKEGDKIIFVKYDDKVEDIISNKEYNIWIMDSNGNNRKQLTYKDSDSQPDCK